jgi:hypothetical protein
MSDAITFSTAWYADQRRAESLTKFIVYDDKGTLEIIDAGITFSGVSERLDIPASAIESVRLDSMRFNWLMSGGLIVVAGSLQLLVNGIVVGGVTMVGLIIMTYFFATNMKFAVVRYRGKDGSDRQAYFADATNFGWSGISGGTAAICDAIAGRVHKDAKPQTSS